SCASCPGFTPVWKISSAPSIRPGMTPNCHHSCGSEAGSAAIATGIRSSPPRCCVRPCGSRAIARLASISTSYTCWAASFRSTPIWCERRRNCGSWRSALPTGRRTARTSPIAARSPASMHGSQPRPGHSTDSRPRAAPWARRRLMKPSPNCKPTAISGNARQRAMDASSRRAAAEVQLQYGKEAVPNYVISKTDGVSDILEVALLLKEAGLLRPREGELDVNIIPLFETIADLRNCSRVMDELLELPEYQRL